MAEENGLCRCCSHFRVFLVDNVIERGTYPDYEQLAAAWMKQHIAPDAHVYFDDARMRYYTGTAWGGRSISWDGLLAEMRQYHQIQQFIANNGNKVLIFRGDGSAHPSTHKNPGSDLKGMK